MGRVVYKYNGKAVTRQQLDELVPAKPDWMASPPMTANTYTEHNPLVSEGCGVHRSQVGETRELIRKHGIVGASVMDGGQIRFTSRRARKEFLRMRGMADLDGGYSDG